MKRNKTVSILLILSMLAACFACPVFAADEALPEVSVRAIGEKVEFSATFPDGLEGDEVNYMIVTKDTTQEMLDGKEGALLAHIKALDSGVLDSSKSITAAIRLSAAVETGTYKLVLSSVSLPQAVMKEFDFVQPQEIKDALKAVNDAQVTGNDYSAVETAVTENASSLGIDLTDFSASSFSAKKNDVLRQIKSVTYDPENYNAEIVKLQALFGGAMMQGLVELSNSVSEMDSAVADYRMYVSFDLTTYDQAKQKGLLNGVYNSLKGKNFDDTDDFYNELMTAVFFAEFNAAGSKKAMRDLFEEYNGKYFTITIPAKVKSKDALFTYLSKRDNYKDASDLQNEINKYADSLDSGSGSNGGGGGSRPGPGPDDIVIRPTATPTPTNTPNDIGNVFHDLDSVAWAKESIQKLYDNQVIAEDPSKRFRPEDSITREEFVKMLVVSLDILDENAQCSFDDVSEADWFYPYIASAVSKGVVKGVSDTSFGVGQNVTRQDIAALVYRAAENLNVALEQNNPEKDFSDKADISDYAVEAIRAMTKAGIINGYEDNTFQPHHTATRAEAAVMIAKFAF